MIEGQCLCGAVQYQYHGVIEKSIICFCQDCQKAQGAFGGWNSPIEQNKLSILSGQENLAEYFHTELKARVFCNKCGSPIYSYRKDLPNIVRLRLGTITKGDIPKPKELAYLQNKPDFMNIE